MFSTGAITDVGCGMKANYGIHYGSCCGEIGTRDVCTRSKVGTLGVTLLCDYLFLAFLVKILLNFGGVLLGVWILSNRVKFKLPAFVARLA